MHEMKVLLDSRDGFVAVGEGLVWVEWRNCRDTAIIRTIEDAIDEEGRRWNGGRAGQGRLLYLHRVAANYTQDYDGRLPSRALSQALLGHLNRIESAFEASVVVIEPRGTLSRLLRGFASMVTRVVPSPVPTRVFGELRPALTWLGQRAGRRELSAERIKWSSPESTIQPLSPMR